MSPESGYNPEAELEAQKFQVDKTIAFVDASQDNHQRARDIAEAELLEEKEGINNERTWKNLVPRLWNNFKFTKKYEYARQKKIAEAKKRMEETGSWYLEEGGAEDTAKEMEAVIERFVAETEEEARHGEKKQSLEEFFAERQQPEKAQEVKGAIKELVSQYATGDLPDKAAFIEARNRAFNGIEGLPDEIKSQMVGHADNMLNVAESARTAFNHHQSLDKLDLDFDILIAQAKTGVRTQAEVSKVDKIVESLKTSPLGRYIPVPTLAAAVAIGYTGVAMVSQSVARSRVVAWGTMGLGALVGGGFAGAHENKRVKEERAQHGRERAQGKKIKDGSTRREQMDQYIGKSIPAKEVAVSMEGLIKENGEYTKEEIETLAAGVAEIDSRIQFSDRNNIDLIRYSDVKLVEQERRDLDIVRAKAKVELSRLAADGKVQIPTQFGNWPAYYENMVKARRDGFKAEKETTDKQFNRFKAKKVAWAATKAVGIGLVVGSVAQEARALVHPGETGLIEGMGGKDVEYATTPMEALRRWMTGAGGSGAVSPEMNQEMAQFADGIENDPMFVGDSTTLNPEQYIKEHPNLFQKVHRTLWYDNDTPKPVFDKNELKLWWGAENNTGVDKNGDYVFDISQMKPNGSYHDQFNVDAQDAMKSGKIKLLLSMSRDTQAQVVELPIGPDGKVIIPKDSVEAKLFFEMDSKGHAVFKGRYAEVAQMMEPKDGVDQVRLLATHTGKGIEGILNEPVPNVPQAEGAVGAIPAPEDGPFIYPPPIIPIHSRREMESLLNPIPSKRTRTPDEPVKKSERGYGYGEDGYGLLAREDYRKRMSSELLENPEMDLSSNDSELVADYLGKESAEYLSELEAMNQNLPPMGKDIEVVITVPAYQEGKNIAKTIANYAKLKDKQLFELVILENHPTSKERDETGAEIEKARLLYPDLNIVHLYKTFEEKPAIGNVRKYLVDSVLQRKQQSGLEKPVVIVSNDADLEDISEDYAKVIASRFRENPKMDAAAGKWDFPAEAFEQFPLMHASQRLWQYFDIAFRNNFLKSPSLIGRNSAFRSSAYAAIGGYNENAKIAEDLEIGWLIQDARNYDNERIQYINAAGLVSNPRRAVTTMLSETNGEKGKIVDQYGDFHVNEDVRNASLEELLADKKDFNLDEFRGQAQAIYDFYSKLKKSQGQWAEDEMVDKSFDRAMRFLGVKYQIENDKVEILDASGLLKGLEKFNKKGVNVYESTSLDRNKEVIIDEPANLEKYEEIVSEYEASGKSSVDPEIIIQLKESLNEWKIQGGSWLTPEREDDLKQQLVKVVEIPATASQSSDSSALGEEPNWPVPPATPPTPHTLPITPSRNPFSAALEGSGSGKEDSEELEPNETTGSADSGTRENSKLERKLTKQYQEILANLKRYGPEVKLADGSPFDEWTPKQKLKAVSNFEKVIYKMRPSTRVKYFTGLTEINLGLKGNSSDSGESIIVPLALKNADKKWEPYQYSTNIEFVQGIEYALKNAWQKRGSPNPLERTPSPAPASSEIKGLDNLLGNFPTLDANRPELLKMAPEVRQEGIRNFIKAAADLKDGFPPKVKINISNNYSIKPGELVIDITKPLGTIKNQLHAGLRRANPDKESRLNSRGESIADRAKNRVDAGDTKTPEETLAEYEKSIGEFLKKSEADLKGEITKWGPRNYRLIKSEADGYIESTTDVFEVKFIERDKRELGKGQKKYVERKQDKVGGTVEYVVPKDFTRLYKWDRKLEDVSKKIETMDSKNMASINEEMEQLKAFLRGK